MTVKTLLVEDQPLHLKQIRGLLSTSGLGLELTTATNGDEALAKYEAGGHELVVTDWSLRGGRDGVTLAEDIKQKAAENKQFVYVILVTGVHPDGFQLALKHGADEFVLKDHLTAELIPRVSVGRRIVEQVRELHTLTTEVRRLSRTSRLVRENGKFNPEAGAGLAALFQQLTLVAPTATTVLLCGERGTGKEEVALAIHQTSGRPIHKFVAVNCGAIPESLVESELFGHEKGAFTGADRKRIGKFEQAQGGTLFLDELGEMPLAAQVKLLRVLESRVVERVGGGAPIPIDVRVIAATSADLHQLVLEEKFRPDLFDRLNVYPIRVPALRERGDDVITLARQFLDTYSPGRIGSRLTPQAEQFLRQRMWPGNVRELKNFVERAVINARGAEIRREHFGAPGSSVPKVEPPPHAVATEDPLSREQLLAGFAEDLAAATRADGVIDLDGLGEAVKARLILAVHSGAATNEEKSKRFGLSGDQYARRLAKVRKRSIEC